MAPIRVGLIGLSKAAKPSWASFAHFPYLNDCNGKYEITALCNSSLTSAQSAIEAFGLPSTTKAYGNPEDLAKDQNVDLVVCSTRVDLHYETIKPSIEQGKNVYVEWPLAANLSQAQELATLAKQKGAKTMIGLQGRVAPIVSKIKSMVEQGAIGAVLSSSVFVAFGSRDSMDSSFKYSTQKAVGGNMVTIIFGHAMDWVNFVLGEFSSFSSQLAIQYPDVAITQDGKVVETVKTDVPDLIILHGTVSSGVPLSATFRKAPPFKGDPAFVWIIHGLTGEIKIQGSNPMLQGAAAGVTIQLHDFAKNEIEEIKWESTFPELPGPARNVATMYEAFAHGDESKYPTFEDALVRHRQIDELYTSSEEGRRGVYI